MIRTGRSAIFRPVLRSLLPLLLLLPLGAPAHAQQTEQARVQATEAYEAGVAAFKAKDFAEALARFERAYKLDPSPVLLYNLARTHQEMRHWTQAIEHFELYLARVPDGDDRADVEARVRTMRNLLAEIEAAKAEPPSEAPPPVEPPPAEPPPAEPPRAEARAEPAPSLRPYAYTAAGLTAVAAGVAIYFGVEAGAA
jgi:tetratricopeptide (TPR) repeat protein